MDSILPPNVPGLDITGVLYSYEIQKNVDDQVKVNIQNEYANGSGYIFRSTDDWNPGSIAGTTINKVVPVPQSNRALWGNGSIEVLGAGLIKDPKVLYNYKVDPCYNPQFDPNCPGYTKRAIVPDNNIDISNLYDNINSTQLESTCTQGDTSPRCTTILSEAKQENISEEDMAETENQQKEKTKERLEKALAASDNSEMFANSFSQAKILQRSNNKINMNSYYKIHINGGVYNESITLSGGMIKDNPKGARLNHSSEKLHNEIVQMQYDD